MRMDDVLLFYRGRRPRRRAAQRSASHAARRQGLDVAPHATDDQACMPEPTEGNQDFVNFGERCTRRVRVVPFDGEKVLFTLPANWWSSNPLRMLRGTKLTLADVVPPTLVVSAVAASCVESVPCEQLSRAERGAKESKNQA